jgi:ACS family pantothenate transporter-like MFS transporter
MKSHPTNKYTVFQLNNYPTGVPAVGIVSTLAWATLTDFMGGKRYLVGYWIAITGLITSALILIPSMPTAGVFAAYYWAGSVYACQATFFAWANDAMRYEEDSLRAVVIASMNAGSGAVNAWWSIVFYSANFAPDFTVSWTLDHYYEHTNVRLQRGMWAMIGTCILLAIWVAGLQVFQRREVKKRVLQSQDVMGSTDDEKVGRQSEKV